MNVEIQHYSFKAWKAQWNFVPTDWWWCPERCFFDARLEISSNR